MDELVELLDRVAPELRELKERCDERDREGGEPLVNFLEELDDLVPELEELCSRTWMLELLIRVCRQRRKRA